jgi:hypothetical protein
MLQYNFFCSVYNYVFCKGISIFIPIYYSRRSCWLSRMLWRWVSCVAGCGAGSVVWLVVALGQLSFPRVGISV